MIRYVFRCGRDTYDVFRKSKIINILSLYSRSLFHKILVRCTLAVFKHYLHWHKNTHTHVLTYRYTDKPIETHIYTYQVSQTDTYIHTDTHTHTHTHKLIHTDIESHRHNKNTDRDRHSHRSKIFEQLSLKQFSYFSFILNCLRLSNEKTFNCSVANQQRLIIPLGMYSWRIFVAVTRYIVPLTDCRRDNILTTLLRRCLK